MHKLAPKILLLLTLGICAGGTYAEDEGPRTFDNLVAVEESNVAKAYIDPDADFSVFSRVQIMSPHVAFRTNWKRDQNRSRSRSVRARDMDRIKEDVATQFERVFAERLEAAGYTIVEAAGEDTLVIRPAIINLDVTAPDTRSAGRSRSYVASAGSATLYMQLWDGMSGEILGRAADSRAARSGGQVTWANSVTNNAEARRLFGRWADQLVDFLGKHYEISK